MAFVPPSRPSIPSLSPSIFRLCCQIPRKRLSYHRVRPFSRSSDLRHRLGGSVVPPRAVSCGVSSCADTRQMDGETALVDYSVVGRYLPTQLGRPRKRALGVSVFKPSKGPFIFGREKGRSFFDYRVFSKDRSLDGISFCVAISFSKYASGCGWACTVYGALRGRLAVTCSSP